MFDTAMKEMVGYNHLFCFLLLFRHHREKL